MSYPIQFNQFSEVSILVTWPPEIDELVLYDILNYKEKLRNFYIKQKVELVNTYTSLLIIYRNTIEDVNSVFLELKSIYFTSNTTRNTEVVTWEIPVCYTPEFAVDANVICRQNNLNSYELIQLHQERTYTVYFTGFLPGFLYLGGLNKRLCIPRKSNPSRSVGKGSVAIGGQQTGIYPEDSPGGWYVIGNTPVSLFEPKKNPPCSIMSGDRLRFKAVSYKEHQKITDQVNSGKFKLKSKIIID